MRTSTKNKIKSFFFVVLGTAFLGLSVSILTPSRRVEMKKIEKQKEIIKENLKPILKEKFKDKDIEKLMKKYEDFKKKK